ncbi:hypothetical protein FE257_000213 [Aspergillus nanangensis]|uniref:Oleate hydratase n=1 Tax=Aspergillus nanangensis TaxID=2582783 RepID=A0AAD4CZ40_ASPNN|nr:hypothetical protein FE257_000213 [Aspergillus nanangensis]
MRGHRATTRRSPGTTEAWILGSGTAALASALYLIHDAQVPASKVHILDSNKSLGQAIHNKGDAINGYDQFAGCLPVPVGTLVRDILTSIPSAESHGQSVFDEIKSVQDGGLADEDTQHPCFLIQRDHVLKETPTKSLNLSLKHRLAIFRLILMPEKQLRRNQISDYLPETFFRSSFWAIWSAQFAFQPWHSAIEFRRALRQYLREFRTLSLLSCLDITGYYQHESIFLPTYLFLRSLGVDFQFDTRVDAITTSVINNQLTVDRIQLIQGGLGVQRYIGPNNIVIANLGSTVSGSNIGHDDQLPFRRSIEPTRDLDENWSLWLELGTKYTQFGDPYTFCTRQSESMLESFTATATNSPLFDRLCSVSHCSSRAGAFIALQESRWKLNICLPVQPVFSDQPHDVKVFWGFATRPECEGDFVDKPMVRCSGTEIMTEILKQVDLDPAVYLRNVITIPRFMPRMSSSLLSRAFNDRPEVTPRNTSNIAVIGHFVEIPNYTSVDLNYGVRTAKKAVSDLMGLKPQETVGCDLPFSFYLRMLFWK